MSMFMDEVEYRFFDHLFAVSRCGKVLKKLTPYTPILRKDGYLRIGTGRLLHRMVATCWVEKPPDSKVVHHINEDKTDNHANNLEWTTQKIHMGERHKGCRGPAHWSEASRERMRIFRTGRKDSPEVRQKKLQILAVVRPKRRCEIHGIQYSSIRIAAIILRMPVTTARLRCLSKNFPDYKLV